MPPKEKCGMRHVWCGIKGGKLKQHRGLRVCCAIRKKLQATWASATGSMLFKGKKCAECGIAGHSI